MDQEPDLELSPDDSLGCSWFAESWQYLPWSPWVPFAADRDEFLSIPKAPGLYRIRPKSQDFLMYIGETGKMLHQKLAELRQTLRRKDLMPWGDPFAVAPALWAWHEAEGYEYECSAVALDASAQGRRGMECFLIAQYRQEYGSSPLCSLGRFHPRYRRSTNRKENRRGGRLGENQKDNPAGGLSLPPLPAIGGPGDTGWMGLSWSSPVPLAGEPAGSIPHAPGLWLLLDAEEVLLIGQSADCAGRIPDLYRNFAEGCSLQCSYHIPEQPFLPHQLKEMETDLIGNYFEHYRKSPELQFRSTR
jgi:hypothetical protein